MKIVWMKKDNEKIIKSLAELDKTLDLLTVEAQQSQPFIIELVANTGNVMGFGIGYFQTVLSFVQSSLQPPYLVSRSSQFDESEGDVIVFDYFGAWTEFPTRNAIPMPEAREVLRDFFVTGTLPSRIKWEEV